MTTQFPATYDDVDLYVTFLGEAGINADSSFHDAHPVSVCDGVAYFDGASYPLEGVTLAQAFTHLRSLALEHLGREYVAEIGYNPFDDDQTATIAGVCYPLH